VKERPIIFDAESVRAISRGDKTQTRRAFKIQPIKGDMPELEKERRYNGCVLATWQGESEFDGYEVHCPYGQPGDHLWVRETYAVGAWGPDHDPAPDIHYRAHHSLPACAKKWKSPIYMPRRMSRFTLQIQDIRIETLQQIKFKDVLREGVGHTDEQKMRASFTGAAYQREWLKTRWDGINAKRGYPFDSNPWVWVVEFRLVRSTTRQSA